MDDRRHLQDQRPQSRVSRRRRSRALFRHSRKLLRFRVAQGRLRHFHVSARRHAGALSSCGRPDRDQAEYGAVLCSRARPTGALYDDNHQPRRRQAAADRIAPAGTFPDLGGGDGDRTRNARALARADLLSGWRRRALCAGDRRHRLAHDPSAFRISRRRTGTDPPGKAAARLCRQQHVARPAAVQLKGSSYRLQRSLHRDVRSIAPDRQARLHPERTAPAPQGNRNIQGRRRRTLRDSSKSSAAPRPKRYWKSATADRSNSATSRPPMAAG